MTRRTAPAALVLASCLAACGGAPPAKPAVATDSAPPVPAFADSLALEAPGGVQVWFTQGRTGRRADGTTCAERVMEVRRDGKAVPVPLLYTGEVPVLVNDSTMQAHIWLDCTPGNLYAVNLRTGWPTFVKGKS